jgi:hypothetical protein
MAGNPAGRTSSVKANDKTFILQTEFKITPRQAIVTTVTLDGQVIHKVEKSYLQEIESELEFREAETAILAQHESIARKIIANSADFIRQTKSIKISRADRLGVIRGVSYVADVDKQLEDENSPTIYRQAKLITQICDGISASSRMGSLRAAAIISEQGKYVLDGMGKQRHLVTLKEEADIGKIIPEIVAE